MTKLEAIAAAKTFRKDADELLQRMKQRIPRAAILIRPWLNQRRTA